MYLSLAWRNIWRNSGRTTAILLAIVIGVWSMIVLGAFAQGMLESIIHNGVSTLTGHIQIHRSGYRADPVVAHSIRDTEAVENALQSCLPDGAVWTSRVKVTAVANNARHTSGVTLVGIEPEREERVSFIGSDAVEGIYLDPDDEYGILVGKELAETMETGAGKKLVLMSQDTSGEIASRAFRIAGLFEAEMQATEKQYAFITKKAAQDMLGLERSVSEVCVLLPDRAAVDRVAGRLRDRLSADTFAVYTWKELLPLVRGYLAVFEGYLYLMYVVVFIAMGFGIVNTILMAVMERMREFGLLQALGMKPVAIIKEVVLEACMLLIIGMCIGNGIGCITGAVLSGIGIDLSAFAQGSEYVGMSRVIYPQLRVQDVAAANLVVFVLGVAVSLYPALKAARFHPVETLTRTQG